MSALTVKDKMTIDLERQWWKYTGAKEAKIRELFTETATRYYQRLSVLIDQPEAMAYDAMVVKRLRRLRHARRDQRSGARAVHG